MNTDDLKTKALDYIRCGIAANYSGERRDELMLQIYDNTAAIFEELEAVKAERDKLKEKVETWDRCLRASVPDKYKTCASPVGAVQNLLGDYEQEIDQIRARIETAEKQEPFGHLIELDGF